jgi:nucleotidyltransferase/DNA polymerase involved in DNA repair
MTSTIACVYIADFGLSSGTLPTALVDYGQRRARVAAASASARAAGVLPGISLTRARALCPNLTPQPLKQERIDTLRDRLLNTLWTYTNRIELDADAMPQAAVLWLDLGRTKDDDAQMLGERIRAAVGRIGLTASVGIGRGKFTALAAATHTDCLVRLVKHGEDAAFLAPLPVSLLSLKKEDARRLDLLGIRTLGQFATLPRSAISAQFGKLGRTWHLLASGQDARPVRPYKMPDFERVGIDFDNGIIERRMLDDALSRFAGTLSQRLEVRASAAHEISLTIHYDRGATKTERLQRVQPLTEVGDLRRTLYTLLDTIAPDAPVCALTVTLSRLSATAPRQLGLFDQRPRGQATLDLAAELSKRYGPCFFTAEVGNDSPLAERRFKLIPFKREDAS